MTINLASSAINIIGNFESIHLNILFKLLWHVDQTGGHKNKLMYILLCWYIVKQQYNGLTKDFFRQKCSYQLLGFFHLTETEYKYFVS